MKQFVSASAPAKLMLTGSFAVLYGHPTVVTAVDQRLKVRIEVLPDSPGQLLIEAPDLGINGFTTQLLDLVKATTNPLRKELSFVLESLNLFSQEFPDLKIPHASFGLNISTSSQFEARFGLGSSSAVTVALMASLGELFEVNLSRDQLFDLCYRVLASVQGEGSGFDLASAIWGGTIVYRRPGQVEELKVAPMPLSIIFTGYKVSTSGLVARIGAEYQAHPELMGPVFDQIGQASLKMATSLEKSDWSAAGETLFEHHRLGRQLGVSGVTLDRLVAELEKSGLWGASLSGSGGGDCVPVFHSAADLPAVEQVVSDLKLEIIKASVGASGVMIE